MTKLEGILPAIVTPVDSNGKFAGEPFARLLDRLYQAGTHGMYVCGQTGEGLLQPVAQRKVIAEEALRNSPRGKQVIIHTGAYSTADAVELTRHASRIGVTAVSSLPPAGAYAFAEIKAYYEALASASDVPVLVYYFPSICPAITTVEQILELTAIPGVVGLKFTDFDLYRLMILRESGAIVYNGADEVLSAGLLMGANGGIGSFYNLVPELFLTVWNSSRSGEWHKAIEAQKRINQLIRLTLRYPGVPAIKQILTWMGIECGPALLPRRPLAELETAALRTELEQAELVEMPATA